MNKNVIQKLCRIVAVSGLILSQLGGIGLPLSYAEINENISTSISSETGKLTDSEQHKSKETSLKELVSEDSHLKMTIKSEAGFQSGDIIMASLAASKEDKALNQYRHDIAKVSRHLRGQGKVIVDARVVTLNHQTKQEGAITATLTFKKGLFLNGISASNKNLRVGLVSSSDKVQLAEVTADTREDSLIKTITYTGSLSQRIVVVTTRDLKEEETLDLGQYGRLLIDGAVSKRDEKDSVGLLSKAMTINILTPKKSAIESSLNPDDFETVKTIDNLYTWNDQFYLLDFISKQYEVLKTDYQSAKDSNPQTRDVLFGEYAVESLVTDKGRNNTINIYIRSTKPLGLKPMGAAPAALQPRAFRSLTPRSTRMRRSAPVEKPKGELEHHKRIDYLGDNQNNPDTTVDDSGSQHDTSDLYRLYLDMTGKKNPLDILVVVDKSGSMQDGIGVTEKYRYVAQRWDPYDGGWHYETFDYDTYQGNSFSKGNINYSYRGKVQVSSGTRRDQAVKEALLGDSGLLKKFTEINSKNNVGVIGFQGSIDYLSGKQYQKPNGTIGYQPSEETSKDADVLQQWTHTPNLDSNQLTAMNNNGTNYHAALLKAEEMLNQVAGNGHRKIMVFISDGVPTFYFEKDGYRNGNGTTQPQNVLDSQQGTKLAIDQFKERNPDLSLYTLGVSKDINSDTASSSPVVLKYLSGEGYYYGITDTAELEKTANKIVEDSKISNLNISDTLSQYVDYYEQQPDLLVTRTSKSTKEVQTLFKDNRITNEGKDIIDKVLFTPKTDSQPKGKVTLTFKPDYKVDDEYTYTLSFNVKASDEAYEKYKDKQGQYEEKGDSDTDYKENQTSSGKGGLPSNSDASVNYMADGRSQKLAYKQPVIQVKTIPIRFTKVDADDSQKKLDGVNFELRKADKKTIWEKGTTASNGQLEFKYLQKGKTYYLYETKAKGGYGLPRDPWEVKVDPKGNITVTGQDNKVISSDNEKTYVLKNHRVAYPETGGLGTIIFTQVGLILIGISGILYYQRSRK